MHMKEIMTYDHDRHIVKLACLLIYDGGCSVIII
jgi:hypothetical protein